MLLRLYFYAQKQQECWCTFVRSLLKHKTNKHCVRRDLNLFRVNDASGNNAYENLKSGRIVRRKTNKCKKLLINKIIYSKNT